MRAHQLFSSRAVREMLAVVSDSDAPSAPTRPLGPRNRGDASAPPTQSDAHAPTLVGAQPRNEAAPATLGRFTVQGKLGQGGMGVVFRGHDPALDREVALKLVSYDGAEARARLVREAQAMARVAHPNVVPVYEVGEHGDQMFIAMELIRGTTLATWLERERSWRDVLRVLVDAGRGLAAAHRAGILHRDFKPDNVLIGEDGRARVVDFGLARGLDRSDLPDRDGRDARALDSALTHHGTVVGTPAFMSPEHFDGDLTPLADQWSFAVTAYVALFGRMPFGGRDLRELRETITTTIPTVPPLGEVPPVVADAILRGMHALPEERFPSLEEMLAVFEEVLAVDPRADSGAYRRQRRNLVIFLGVIGVINLLATGAHTGFRFDIAPRGLAIQAFIAFFVLGACAVVARRTLWRTAHDRRVLGLFLIVMGSIGVHRLMSLDASVVPMLRTDAVFSAALLLLAALTIERWFVLSAAVMALYVALTFAAPAAAVGAFPLALLGTIALGIWFWRDPVLPRLAASRSSPRTDDEAAAGRSSAPTSAPTRR